MPDKKEREEIGMLKNQLQEVQEELKRKESRWTSSIARLKNRLAEMELENGELKEEIRILERKRLEWMSNHNHSSSVGILDSTNSVSGMSVPKQTINNDPHSNASALGKDKNRSTTSSAKMNGDAPRAPLSTGVSTVTASRSQQLKSPVSMPAKPVQSKSLPMTSSMGAKSKAASNPTRNSGEGFQTQKHAVPVMMENTLLEKSERTSANGLHPSNGNVAATSPVNASQKSAALVAMEKAVVDKGDPMNFVETVHGDGKVEKSYKTGAKEIHFPNGTIKEISADGQTIVCRLANGDICQIFPDHRVVYIFADAQIMQTTFPDGLEAYQFKNDQIERRYPDGTVQITFPSKDIKYLFPDGGQEVILTDGTVMQYNNKGERTVEYPSGDREVHTAEYQGQGQTHLANIPVILHFLGDDRLEKRIP